jgi:ketosteroid isomerase-like protein
MSESNLELARRGYAAFADGNVVAVLDFLSPEIVCYSRPAQPEQEVFHGHEGFARLVARDFFQTFGETVRVEPERFIDEGDYVLVPVRIVGAHPQSGVELQDHLVHVWRFEGGKAVELRPYEDMREASQALGLESDTMRAPKRAPN